MTTKGLYRFCCLAGLLLSGSLGASARSADPIALVDPSLPDSASLLLRFPTTLAAGVPVVRASEVARVAGATRYWRADVRKVVFKSGEHKLRISMDNRFAVLDGAPFNLQAPANAVDGEPGVPVVALAGVLSALTDLPFVWKPTRGEVHAPPGFGARLEQLGATEQRTRLPLSSPEPPRTSESSGPIRRVVIDAAHGGRDAGVRGSRGLQESQITLDIARRLRSRLRAAGLEVVLTREADNSLSSEQRAAIANRARADLLVSIHVNKAWAPRAQGFEVYCMSDPIEQRRRSSGALDFVPWENAFAGHERRSWEIARELQLALSQDLKLTNRGVNRAQLELARAVNMPSVQVEVGFVSNANDAALLRQPKFRERVAGALARGIQAEAREPQQEAGQ